MATCVKLDHCEPMCCWQTKSWKRFYRYTRNVSSFAHYLNVNRSRKTRDVMCLHLDWNWNSFVWRCLFSFFWTVSDKIKGMEIWIVVELWLEVHAAKGAKFCDSAPVHINYQTIAAVQKFRRASIHNFYMGLRNRLVFLPRDTMR